MKEDKINKKIIFIPLILILTVTFMFFYKNESSSNFNKIQLDNYLETLEESNKYMGSVAVLKEGKLIYSKNTGFSDYENKIKANENTKYRIGSASKTFTAVLTLKAVEEGKLSLEDTLDKFFPNITNAKDIKIEYLLNHRSGIYSVTSDPDFLTWRTEPKTHEEILKIIKSEESQFVPNSKVGYSNSNYILLTYILEEIYQKPYSKILEEKITTPLELKDTYLDDKINTLNNESKSYKLVSDWSEDLETDISIPLGAGGIASNTVDLAKFVNELFSGKILKLETVEKMKNTKDTIGLGIFEIVIDGKVAYGHPGAIDSFQANYIYIPEDDLIFTFTTNGLGDITYQEIQKTVLDAIYNKPFEIPEFASTYNVTSEDLDKYLGIYSTPDIESLKVIISKNENVLTIKGLGENEFAFTATSEHKFRVGIVNAKAEFKPDENKMIWEQNGQVIILEKESN